MDKLLKTLSKIWLGVELPGYRPSDSTYHAFWWSNLPLLKHNFTGKFEWLNEPFNPEAKPVSKKAKVSKLAEAISELEKELKITFPSDFVDFVNIPGGESLIVPSVTDCYFAKKITLKPFLSGYILPVYFDSQDVSFWFLYFESNKKECSFSTVLSSSIPLTELIKMKSENLQNAIEICEENFEKFLFRLQIENIAYKCYCDSTNPMLTPYWQKVLAGYIDFYDQNKWKPFFVDLDEKAIENRITEFELPILLRYKLLSESFIERFAKLTKDWIYVCKYQSLSEDFLRKNIDKLDWQLVCACQKLSETFIVEFSDQVFWRNLGLYQELSEDFIRKYHAKMDWQNIVSCQKLSIPFIKEFEEKIDWKQLSLSQKMTVEFLKTFENKIHWNYLAFNKHFSVDFIDAFPEKMNWHGLSTNQELPEEVLRKYHDKVEWNGICLNQSLSENFIEEFKDFVDWDLVSNSQKISEAFIEKFKYWVNPEKLLNNDAISANFKTKVETKWKTLYNELTEDEIRKHPNDFNFTNLSQYKQLSDKFIEDFVDQLDWQNLCVFQMFSENSLQKFKDRMDWYVVSYTQKLSENSIREFHDQLDWDQVSECQILSEDLIREFQDKVNWSEISEYQKLSEPFIREFHEKLDWW